MRWLVVAIAGLVLFGCGPKAQSEPRTIDPETVPFGLLKTANGAGPTDAGADTTSLYFVGAHHLTRVERPTADPINPKLALRALLDGPSEAELDRGLSTTLPSGRTARLIDRSGDVVRVDLAPEFGNGTIPNQTTALAQIVLTLTATPGVSRVVFLVDGQPAAVPRGDGSITRAPVEAADFASLTSDL